MTRPLLTTPGFFVLALQLLLNHEAVAMQIGKFQVDPYVSVTETITDNVFTTATNPLHDMVTTMTPGASIVYPFRVHQLNLDYHAVLKRYDEYRSERTTDHYANGLLALQFGSLVALRLSDSYIKGHEPRSASTTGVIEKFKTNNATASLTYQLVDRSKVQFDYSAVAWKFRDSTFRDRREGLISGYLYYRFLPKTSVFLEYDMKSVDFSEDTNPLDNDMSSALLGITWERARQSKGTVKYGRTSKDFTDQLIEDYDDWTASVDIQHHFTNYTSVAVVGQRVINETNRVGTRFFVTTAVAAEITHRFGYRLAGVVRGAYGTDVYSDIVPPETIRREDDVVSAGGGFKYTLRDKIEAALLYTVRSRDSNIDANDYREHQYSATLSIVL